MNLKTKLLLFMTLFFGVSLFAQNSTYTLTGKVLDVDNIPLIGVNVLKSGTAVGTITDIDGSYSLAVARGDVIEFSYTGFETQSITITDQTSLDISMASDAELLDEVVVVGYGTRKKSDVTGSVSSVTTEELTAFPVLNAEQALQGRAAGVVVQSNNGGEPGAPTAIRIRGNTSILSLIHI